MEASLHQLLAGLSGGEVQRHHRLAVIPLFDGTWRGISYTTLSSALASESFRITEVSEGGSVPDLLLVNELEEAVLLIDGEELSGAKQNRVLNATVLAAAHSKIVIPVSCTEQGRWSYSSPRFSDSGVVMAARSRAAKSADVRMSLEQDACFRSDQLSVWSNVGEMHARLGVHSDTGAMRDAYAARQQDLDAAVQAFPCQPRQTGLAVAVDGRLIGLEIVSLPEAYAQVHRRLVQSYAMEALLGQAEEHAPTAEPENLSDFTGRILSAQETKHKSIGLGWDHRYQGEEVVGSSLFVEDRPVHTAFFRIDREAATNRPGRMSGASMRAGFRRGR